MSVNKHYLSSIYFSPSIFISGELDVAWLEN